MYYLRTRPAANAIQFTVDKTLLQQTNKENTQDPIDTSSDMDPEEIKRRIARRRAEEEAERAQAALECSINNREACLMCSS